MDKQVFFTSVDKRMRLSVAVVIIAAVLFASTQTDLDVTNIAVGVACLIVFTAVFMKGRPKHEGEAALCEREELMKYITDLRRSFRAHRKQKKQEKQFWRERDGKQEKRRRGCSLKPAPRIGKVTDGSPIRYNGLVDPLLS